MRFSHSRVETFKKCPYLYKLRYLDGVSTIPNTDDPSNALLLGTGIHKGIETSAHDGINEYLGAYPVINDLHLNEALKFEVLIPKVQAMLAGKDVAFEYKLECQDFLGYIDALVHLGGNEYAIYDFKYSNNVDRYLESTQLHVYKYYFEALHPSKYVTQLGFIFIPKVQIRQKKTETLADFRRRLKATLEPLEPVLKIVPYDQNKTNEFFADKLAAINATEFPKNETRLCDWCDYQLFCKQGVNYMLLPKDERRAINAASRKKIWLYGAPFSGKTTLADQFPHTIMLNTDGNLNSFTSPYVEIKETFEGRIKVSAWDNFNAAINELQKGNHTYETVCVDLIEDTYEHCRRWCYDKLGIEHESDNSFKAWDFVRNEFLTTVKKLMTLPYNIVLISHEDLSKDITKKSGDKITSIRPNIQDKLANKLAGMVDIVARVTADGDARTLNFKSDHVVFGGGRLKILHTTIPCTYAALCQVYAEQVTDGPAMQQAPVMPQMMQAPQQMQMQPQMMQPMQMQQMQMPQPAMQPPVMQQAPMMQQDPMMQQLDPMLYAGEMQQVPMDMPTEPVTPQPNEPVRRRRRRTDVE